MGPDVGQRVPALGEKYWAMSIVFCGEEVDLCLPEDTSDYLNCLGMERPFPWGHIVHPALVPRVYAAVSSSPMANSP